jgi:hypothetical protein
LNAALEVGIHVDDVIDQVRRVRAGWNTGLSSNAVCRNAGLTNLGELFADH